MVICPRVSSDGKARFEAKGFTLVEVTIALAVFAFALIPLVGMMPVAMNSARDSLEISTTTQIAERLASELGQQRFSSLKDEGPIYFDDSGQRLPSHSAQAIYEVRVVLGTLVLNSGDPPLTSNLKRASIEIRSVRHFDEPRKFSYLIFNQGRQS